MKNQVKEKFLQQETVFGTFSWAASEGVVEALGYAGFDFLVIDTEHNPMDETKAVNLLRVAQLKGLSPFVRVRDASRDAILKMLDGGAAGLVVPGLVSVEEVQQMIRHGKYAPLGERGFAQSRPAGFGFELYAKDIPSYFELCNQETLLLPMCETAGFLNQVEEIAALPGVDGIFVGPFDLSVALQAPGQFDTLEFNAALQRIVAACQANAKPAFIFCANPGMAMRYAAMGYQGLALGIDLQVLVASYRSLVQEVQQELSKQPQE